MAAGATPFNAGGSSLRFPTEVGTDEVPNYITFRPELVDFGTSKGQSTLANYGNAFTKPSLQSYKPSARLTTQLGSAQISFNNPFAALKDRIDGFVSDISKKANINFDLPKGLGSIDFDFGGTDINKVISGRLNLGPFSVDIGNNALNQNSNTVKKMPGMHLYLPPEISHQTQADVGKSQLGMMGATALDFAGNGLQGDNTTEKAIDGIAKIATSAIQDRLSDQVEGVLQRGTGLARNRYTYAIFKGMEHRTFNYSFNLIAKDQDETKVIKDLCDTFMFYMLPFKPSQDNFYFYDVPCMWDIGYNRLGQKISYLDQPNKCYLKDVKITYGADAFGQTYNDGAPITVRLDLSFMEIEPLLRAQGARHGVNIELYNSVKEKVDSFLNPADETNSGGNGA